MTASDLEAAREWRRKHAVKAVPVTASDDDEAGPNPACHECDGRGLMCQDEKPCDKCWRKPTPVANDVQVGGDHYRTLPIQPWDFIGSNNLDFFQGNIIKYVTRWKTKDGIEALLKARHFLDKYIELNTKK